MSDTQLIILLCVIVPCVVVLAVGIAGELWKKKSRPKAEKGGGS